MQRRTFAALSIGVGLLVGALATLFFYDKQFGLSVPLFVGIVSAALLVLSVPAGRRINRRNLWPLLPILFFALMVAVRDDWMILWLNLGAITALGALLFHYLTLQRPLDTDSFAEQTGSVLQAGFMLLPYAAAETGQAWAWLREARHDRGRQFTSVLRGLAFAAPVILVFALLLGSADAVFAGYVNGAFDGIRRMLGIDFMSDGIAQIGATLIFGAIMTGAIAYGLMRRMPETASEAVDSDGDPLPLTQNQEKRKPAFKLSMIESGIVLGSVVLLFAAFVVVQFTYFFGGESNVGIQRLTYAQYARRGFFELVAVSTMTLGLALFLDRVTMRHDGRENTVFRGLSVLLAALTTVLVTSAAQRMWLYEEAYGFTQLRVYTHVAIVWLGVMLGVFVLALFRLRRNVFSLGTLLVLIGYLGTLNLMNVDYYIAERNIARQAGQELDIAFLNTLSADAVPVILPFFQQLQPDSEVRAWAGQWLARQIYILEGKKAGNGSTIFSFNAGQETALMMLNSTSDPFPEYDSSLWYSSFWSTTDAEYEDYRDATAESLITPVTR